MKNYNFDICQKAIVVVSCVKVPPYMRGLPHLTENVVTVKHIHDIVPLYKFTKRVFTIFEYYKNIVVFQKL